MIFRKHIYHVRQKRFSVLRGRLCNKNIWLTFRNDFQQSVENLVERLLKKIDAAQKHTFFSNPYIYMCINIYVIFRHVTYAYIIYFSILYNIKCVYVSYI